MLLIPKVQTTERQEFIDDSFENLIKVESLKKEVNFLLEKIKKLGDIEVKEAFFKSAGLIRVKLSSDGKLFWGQRYYDPEMTYIRTKMNKVTIDDIPEKYRLTILEIQKELMENVLKEKSK